MPYHENIRDKDMANNFTFEVAGSIPSRDELSRGQKNLPRCARRKAWPSRAWARVQGIFPRPGEAVLLPLNEKRWGPFIPGHVFFGHLLVFSG